MGHLDHSVMFDKEYVFIGRATDRNSVNRIYNVPDQVGSFLTRRFPEDVDSANAKGMIFKEVKKK